MSGSTVRAHRHRRPRHPFASRAAGVSALAVVGVTVTCFSPVVASSAGHGVLPLPPPPPPPPPRVSAAAVAEIGENEAIDGGEPRDVPTWPQSTVGGDDDSDDTEMTREPQTVQATQAISGQDGSWGEPVPRIAVAPDNALSGNDFQTGNAERSNQNNISRGYQSITQPNPNHYDPPRPPHHYNPHRQQYHHHQGNWQHQHSNQHPATFNRRGHPPPQGQLAIYQRPQPPSASQSASRLFSFAAKKIQSGIRHGHRKLGHK